MAPRRKLTSREKAPLPVVFVRQGKIMPLTAYDAEEIAGFPEGTEFEMRTLSVRSLPQNRLYWKILGAAVAASETWATKEHLHNDLKMTLGYRRPALDLLTGEWKTSVDSTAFDQMSHEEFRVFFDRAIEALAKYLGVDPFDLLKDGGAR